MTITFFSNFLNDHQLPFCKAMIEQIGEGNFRFVSFCQIDPERVVMGFEDMNETYPFVVQAYKGGAYMEEAYNLMLDSDVAIIGSVIDLPYDKRIKSGKITFMYYERLLKDGYWRWFDPRVQIGIYKRFGRYRNKRYPLYVLCASAYTARDLRLFGFPKSKCLKWGYFPEVREYNDINELLIKKDESKSLSILWVGRFIEWKHPEIPVIIANRLKEDNINFHMKMIGVGDKFEDIRKMIADNDLSDRVSLLGAMPPSDVRTQMEGANFFLFTSDKGEGWGAVLNESLNSACIVFANDSIGSVPFMLKDAVNGYIYHDGNIEELYSKLIHAIKEKTYYVEMCNEAYSTITKCWNARIAVSRFLDIVNNYNGSLVLKEKYGPCSKVL